MFTLKPKRCFDIKFASIGFHDSDSLIRFLLIHWIQFDSISLVSDGCPDMRWVLGVAVRWCSEVALLDRAVLYRIESPVAGLLIFIII